MSDKLRKSVYVSVPVVNNRFSVNLPKACCYCTKTSEDIRFLHLKGKSTTRVPVSSTSMQVITRTAEFDIPYCPEHYNENQHNLERLSTITWFTGIVVFVLVMIFCISLPLEAESPQARIASILFFGGILTVVITVSLLPWLSERYLPKRVSSLRSLGDMLKSKGEDFSQKSLGISINPGQFSVTIQLTNPHYAEMLAAVNNARVTNEVPKI